MADENECEEEISENVLIFETKLNGNCAKPRPNIINCLSNRQVRNATVNADQSSHVLSKLIGPFILICDFPHFVMTPKNFQLEEMLSFVLLLICGFKYFQN